MKTKLQVNGLKLDLRLIDQALAQNSWSTSSSRHGLWSSRRRRFAGTGTWMRFASILRPARPTRALTASSSTSHRAR